MWNTEVLRWRPVGEDSTHRALAKHLNIGPGSRCPGGKQESGDQTGRSRAVIEEGISSTF